jgi:NAD(P)-dependent dehydrogenase (short-subunit alcohol dehydrogenase family)
MPLNDFRLDGKTVLLTGASSGIGQCAAIQAAEHGARVIITGRDEKRLAETFERLPNKQLNHRMIAQAFNTVQDINQFATQLEPLDGVVHSAGISKVVPCRMINEKILNEVHFINFTTPVMLTQQILFKRLLKDSGSIVFLGSLGALVGTKGNGVYASSKAAIMSIAQNLAVELAPKKIRANSLAPGMVTTPMNMSSESPLSPEQLERDQAGYPLGWGKSEDVSNAIIFLLADASRWITGTCIKMDGGLTLV